MKHYHSISLPRWFGTLLFLLPMYMISQTPALHWAKMAQDNNLDLSCYDVAIDPAGFVYTTGRFGGTVDFDPGAGVFNITSAGAFDAYIQKLDTSGNFVWAKTLRGGSDAEGISLGLDNAGNVFVAGYFDGVVDLDPNAGVVNVAAAGLSDLFVLKLNSAGNYLWGKRTGSASCLMMPFGLTVDATGNVYTTGSFTATTDFNPGAGAATHNTVGSYDVFLQKLDAAGNYVMSKTFGGTNTDAPLEISLDAAGNILISGVFKSASMDFDPGAGVFTMGSTGPQSYFVEKLNAAGNFVSAFKLGSPTSFLSGSSVFDVTGNVVSIGSFDATIDMDPGAGVLNFTPTASYDGFIQKVNSANVLQWARQMTSTSLLLLERVATDPSGNIYVAGYFDGTVDLDPGVGVVSYTTANSNTMIVKLDASGNFVWAAVQEGTDYTLIQGLALDQVQNVYAGGYWFGTTDFDPRATVFTMTSPPVPTPQFVFKLRQGVVILPEAAVALTGTALPLRAELAWQGATASAVHHFEIERSVDGSRFEPKGDVRAADRMDYVFTDHGVSPGVHYWYRLKQVDWDGNSSHSETIELTIPDSGATMGFSPNPATESITIWATEAIGTLQILNAMGQVVKTVAGGEAQLLTVGLHDLPAGLYWIQPSIGHDAMRLMVE